MQIIGGGITTVITDISLKIEQNMRGLLFMSKVKSITKAVILMTLLEHKEEVHKIHVSSIG